MEKDRLLIIDSNALLHRAFHALPPLKTQSGEQTGAIYGFLLAFFKAIKDLDPKYVVACFDTKAPTFRHIKFKDYKAQRPKTPDEIILQLPKTKEILKEFDVPVFAKEGFEADDLIATITRKILENSQNIDVYILSGDLDNIQLVNDRVYVYTLGKGIKDTVTYDRDKVFERFSIRPEQMVDFKALVGDSSDNIPGVPGIGQKTAADLLQKFNSLESIYKEIGGDDSVKSRVKEIILKYREEAFLAKELVKMKDDVDIDFNIKDCYFGNFESNKIIEILTRFEFHTLISRLPFLQKEEIKPIQKSLL
jgi:DNA polymerase-1